ncbi:hypothetical protein MNBD_GAMMA11-1498, partial [hydrothermal vent metagenome]
CTGPDGEKVIYHTEEEKTEVFELPLWMRVYTTIVSGGTWIFYIVRMIIMMVKMAYDNLVGRFKTAPSDAFVTEPPDDGLSDDLGDDPDNNMGGGTPADSDASAEPASQKKTTTRKTSNKNLSPETDVAGDDSTNDKANADKPVRKKVVRKKSTRKKSVSENDKADSKKPEKKAASATKKRRGIQLKDESSTDDEQD